MFVHTCRVCSGGNILVASNALMFCILMSLAEIQPLSSKLWGIGPALLLLPSVEIWCISFGRWDSSLVIFFFLFSWRILFKWSRWRQQDPPAIASDISAGGVRIAEGKRKMIIATMRMMVVMMVIMAYHRFSWASECLLGVCLRLRSCFHTTFLPVTFSQLCNPSALLLLHLYHFVSLSSTQTIFCIAFLRATAQTIKQWNMMKSQRNLLSRGNTRMSIPPTHPCLHKHAPQQVHLPDSVTVCGSLNSVVEATRLPGLCCQDLPCLPEDKAITGGGVLRTVVSRYLEHLPHCKCSLHMALRFDSDAC